MKGCILLFQVAACSCLASLAIAAALESKPSSRTDAQKDFNEEREASVRFGQALPVAAQQQAADGDGPSAGFGGSSLPSTLIRTSTFAPKFWYQIERMWGKILGYNGPSVDGLSRDGMRRQFDQNLRTNVGKHLSRSVGGMVFEYGDKSDGPTKTCAKRPSLTIAQVRDIARASFDIRDYELTYPPCNDGGKRVNCNYDGGVCCRRPQVEFIGRYYDTAVSAMALGATLEEAFAPLVHARILAYALESCDPSLSFRVDSALNNFWLRVKTHEGYRRKWWKSAGASQISFPVAYEVLYELYNTMLIERIRSRGKPRFPTDAQMQALNDALYYKKMMASAAYVDLELNPSIMFPQSKHFDAAGLVMATSSRAAQTSRMQASKAAEVMPARDSELHPELRLESNDEPITLYETRTRRWQHVSSTQCNAYRVEKDYYPFKFQTSVWDKHQGCCASECKFMALYGKSFSVHGSNCCAGCNRYRCTANNFDTAEYFAKISAIESAPRSNSGPEEFAFTV